MNDQALTWGLVICTYKREKILPICLELALQQTRQPIEIIVVDASPDWQETKKMIESQLKPQQFNFRWQYVQGEQPSITRQRNQGLKLATADVVFLIDDDSLMYSNCAEEVMKVYEADPQKIISGVEINGVATPPSNSQFQTSAELERSNKIDQLFRSSNPFMQFFLNHVLLAGTERVFIPYEGTYLDYDLPKSTEGLNIAPTHLFEGYKMTYRREAIIQEGFEPLFLYYAAGEDLDASYRVSRHGLLVRAFEAKLCHVKNAGGRVSQQQATALSALNLALSLRKHTPNLNQSQSQFKRLMWRRLLAESIKDILTRRWQFPKARGILQAMKYAQTIFAIANEDLETWYPNFQKQFLEPSKTIT